MKRLADRLRERAAEHFVGRAAELALIGDSLAFDPPPVAVFIVHGPGGIGKTSLLERARALAATHGIDSLRIDARDIEPSPAGLLHALAAALGLGAGDATLASVVERWSRTPRRLLAIDTFERVAKLDGWLRGVFLPELPDRSVTLIAGRAEPDPAWTTDPLWREGARVIALGNLAPADCARLLAARGVGDEHHGRAVQLSYGHPLALTLLADEVLSRGELPEQLGGDVVRRLVERFTADAPSELHRRTLEVCALTRLTSEALLADVVDRERARELFDWLAAQSFVESGSGGLFPHDLARDAIDEDLYRSQHERHRELRLAIRRHLVQRVGSDTRDAARIAFDLLFLRRHSQTMRRFFDFGALGSLWFERGGDSDLPALRPLLAAELPLAQRAAFERWFLHPATAPWLARPAPRKAVAATLLIDLAGLSDAERAIDPVFAAVWRELQHAAPPRAGDLQLLARWNVAAGGQRTSAAMNAIQASHLHQWVTLPRLGAFVICIERPDHWLPLMSKIRFERMAGCDVEVDGQMLGCYLHDWRAEPVAQFFLAMQAQLQAVATPPLPMSKPDFEHALRDALRLWHDRAALAANPLAASAAVRAACAADEAPEAALQRLLHEHARALAERPRDAKFWRALELTYFRPAGSQELAAERLGLPFGTYRYQLATGINRLAARLWALQAG